MELERGGRDLETEQQKQMISKWSSYIRITKF